MGAEQVVRRFFDEVVNGQDLDAVDVLLAADVVDHNRVVLTEPEGPGAARAGIAMLLTAFPDLKADVRQVVEQGDTVAVRFGLQGTNTGEYRYLPAPTQRFAAWEAIGIFGVRDGQISEINGSADRLGMLTQLGLLPDLG